MNKEELISLLSKNDTYVSGQELCEHFGVSRTAIWKAIKQLEKEGYLIEAVNNKGYRLRENDEMMSATEISRYMETKIMGQNLIYHQETDSTNLDVKRLAEEGAVHGTLVVADKQTAGRGRRGRAWISPAGASVYMSLLLRPQCNPDKASAITLVSALAIVQAARELGMQDCGIKWPNDVVANGKKLCGILTEMSAEIDAIHYVVPGIGINVNQETFDEEIAKTATSFCMELGHKVNRSKLISRILYYFEQDYELFIKTYDLSNLVDKYNHFLVNCGKEVRVLDPKGEFTGTALGVNEDGELLVRTENDTVVTVYAGEVSVRGIYGYV